MKSYGFLILCSILLLATSCSKKTTALALTQSQEVSNIASIRSEKKEQCDCYDPNNYAPDDRYPQYQDVKYINTNVHYPNATNLKYNYTGQTAVTYSHDLINNANRKLIKNKKMNLPEGNTTPVYSTGYQYRLAKDPSTSSGLAVYVDQDDEHWDYIKKGKGRNNYNKALIKRFAKNEDTQLNIFAMAYSPDSLARKGFKGGSAGIALGNSVKIAGIVADGKGSGWKFATLLNHEIGHVFGLRHSWYKNDGCDDTPPNANCWGQTETGKCAGVISNNLMDYNNQQMAITPCQIGVVHKNMHKAGTKQRGLVIKDWCEYDSRKTMAVDDDFQLDRAVDMKGDIEVLDGASLRLSCRVHMPKGSKIIVHPGGTLLLNGAYLHNDCGDTWDGIEILTKGDKVGIVEYAGTVKIVDMVGDPPSDNNKMK